MYNLVTLGKLASFLYFNISFVIWGWILLAQKFAVKDFMRSNLATDLPEAINEIHKFLFLFDKQAVAEKMNKKAQILT